MDLHLTSDCLHPTRGFPAIAPLPQEPVSFRAYWENRVRILAARPNQAYGPEATSPIEWFHPFDEVQPKLWSAWIKTNPTIHRFELAIRLQHDLQTTVLLSVTMNRFIGASSKEQTASHTKTDAIKATEKLTRTIEANFPGDLLPYQEFVEVLHTEPPSDNPDLDNELYKEVTQLVLVALAKQRVTSAIQTKQENQAR